MNMPAELFLSNFEKSSNTIYSFKIFFKNCFTGTRAPIKDKIQFVDENDIAVIRSARNIVFENLSINNSFLKADKNKFSDKNDDSTFVLFNTEYKKCDRLKSKG